jgi:pimeloyl-ACP methyl ester carboxylesterase
VWEDCELDGVPAECGMLTVPRDYRHPAGEKLRLAVTRVAHTVPDSQYQGAVLVNPGGPGGSGTFWAILGQWIPDGAGEAYDWIGLDPRGVGASVPALACDGDYTDYGRPQYVPFSKTTERMWLDRARGYAKDCAEAGGELLDHLRTTDNVNDMESLRKALGERKLNFYGFSYGTYLGQVYATRYPDRVRRMVLDSNVDPRRVWYDANLDQDVGFQTAFETYLGWLADNDEVYHLGDTRREVRRLYRDVHRDLDAHPADGLFSGNELDDVFLIATYAVYGWADVGTAFSAWVNDDDISAMRELWEGYYPTGPGTDNGYAMYLATICTDVAWPQSWRVWRRDNWRTYAKAPFFTWANAWFNAPCRTWEGDTGSAPRVSGDRVRAKILLIGETLDPATSFEGSLEVRSRFPRSALIEGVGGTTHAGSLSGVPCVDDAVAAYLSDGTLPARKPGRRSDLRCDPVPAPEPGAGERGAPGRGLPDRLREELLRVVVR